MGLSKNTGKYCKPIAMDQYAGNGNPVNIGVPPAPLPTPKWSEGHAAMIEKQLLRTFPL